MPKYIQLKATKLTVYDMINKKDASSLWHAVCSERTETCKGDMHGKAEVYV